MNLNLIFSFFMPPFFFAPIFVLVLKRRQSTLYLMSWCYWCVVCFGRRPQRIKWYWNLIFFLNIIIKCDQENIYQQSIWLMLCFFSLLLYNNHSTPPVSDSGSMQSTAEQLSRLKVVVDKKKTSPPPTRLHLDNQQSHRSARFNGKHYLSNTLYYLTAILENKGLKSFRE